MKIVSTSETSVSFYKATRHRFPEDIRLNLIIDFSAYIEGFIFQIIPNLFLHSWLYFPSNQRLFLVRTLWALFGDGLRTLEHCVLWPAALRVTRSTVVRPSDRLTGRCRERHVNLNWSITIDNMWQDWNCRVRVDDILIALNGCMNFKFPI